MRISDWSSDVCSSDLTRAPLMIVALLNQKGGVGKTTLALHLAGQWTRQGRRVLLIDADPQGSALDWSQQRATEGLPRLFSVVGLARDTLQDRKSTRLNSSQ